VKALGEAGLVDQIEEWVVHLEGAATMPPDPCAAIKDVAHSHFFTADGQFGSLSEIGEKVDEGDYKIVRRGVLAFPSHSEEFASGPIEVQYTISGKDELAFQVIVPGSCDVGCRRGIGWAFSAFYPAVPWTRQH